MRAARCWARQGRRQPRHGAGSPRQPAARAGPTELSSSGGIKRTAVGEWFHTLHFFTQYCHGQITNVGMKSNKTNTVFLNQVKKRKRILKVEVHVNSTARYRYT